MARTKSAARTATGKGAGKAPAKAPTAPKTATKTGAKAQPAKPPAAKPKTSTKPAKASTKPAKVPAKPAKVPVEQVEVEEPGYSNMKVPELKELLESRGLDTKGLKPALIARLEAADQSGDEGGSEEVEEVDAPEENEETSEPEPAPVEKKTAKGRPAAKPKAPAKPPAAKPKAPTKPTAKPKIAKKSAAKAEEFPDIEIPEVTYSIDAKTLSALIHKVRGDTAEKGTEEFYRELYTALDDYVAPAEEESEDEEQSEKEKPISKGDPEPAPSEKPEMAITFDEDRGAFVDPSGKYLLDPATSSVYAKIVDKEVVGLEKADIAGLSRFKIYEDKKGPLVDRSETEFTAALEKLLQISQEFHDASVSAPEPEPVEEKKTGKAKVAVVIEEEESEKDKEVDPEGEAEGGDDGEEVEVEGEKEEGEVDAVDQVEKEEAEIITKQTDIDEATFSKFLQAQHSEGVLRTDYVAVSKKAGIPLTTGEQIMLQYKLLADKYPQSVAAVKTKKPTAPKATLTEEPQKPQPQGQRRLIKKKQE